MLSNQFTQKKSKIKFLSKTTKNATLKFDTQNAIAKSQTLIWQISLQCATKFGAKSVFRFTNPKFMKTNSQHHCT